MVGEGITEGGEKVGGRLGESRGKLLILGKLIDLFLRKLIFS